jgi:hypothetical protein
VLEALRALAHLGGCLKPFREPCEPLLELAPGFLVGIVGHRRQPFPQPDVQPVEDPGVDHVGEPAGSFGLEPLAQFVVVGFQVAVGRGEHRVEQRVVVALRHDGPQCLPGEWRDVDGVRRAGQFGGDDTLHVLVAERSGRLYRQVRGVSGEPGGVALVGQPGRQAGGGLGRLDAVGEDVGVEEVLLDELAERGRELVLALDDQSGVRDRQAQGTTEQGRHREPVRDAADHRRLGAGLHVAEQGPVGACHGHADEQGRHHREERGGPSARDRQAALALRQRFAPVPGRRP